MEAIMKDIRKRSVYWMDFNVKLKSNVQIRASMLKEVKLDLCNCLIFFSFSRCVSLMEC